MGRQDVSRGLEMATPQLVAMRHAAAIPRHPSLTRKKVAVRPPLRCQWEFWAVCLIVSLGLVESLPIGFYKFRLADSILDLSLVYAVVLIVERRLSRGTIALLLGQIGVLGLRITLEGSSVSSTSALRTLLGMGAIYLTPFIFFVVRESRINRRTLIALLVLSWIISLLSQTGLLSRGESYASGMVDLAQLLHISSFRAPALDLDYQEATVTIWRALSVGSTLAVVIAAVPRWTKVVGVIGLVLQFAGGGGGRSSLVFAFATPFLLYLRPAAERGWKRTRKLLVALIVSTALAAFYLWSPLGGSGPVKGDYEVTHFQRVTEVFIPFLEGWGGLTDSPNILNARGISIQQYWEGIISSPRVFFLGVGLAEGAGFKDTPNVLAHNIILDVWALAGLVGLFFFLSFIAYVVRDLWMLLKVSPHRGETQFLGFTIATAVIFMFQWLLFQAATADRSFMIVFYLLAGLLRPTARWIEARRALGR